MELHQVSTGEGQGAGAVVFSIRTQPVSDMEGGAREGTVSPDFSLLIPAGALHWMNLTQSHPYFQCPEQAGGGPRVEKEGLLPSCYQSGSISRTQVTLHVSDIKDQR